MYLIATSIAFIDLDLNFVYSIGSRGKVKVKVNLRIRSTLNLFYAGNMYVAEFGNKSVAWVGLVLKESKLWTLVER